jgi:hypothetical protein
VQVEFVEGIDPIAQGLPIQTPYAGRCLPGYRRQRQQSTRVVAIVTAAAFGTQTLFERNRNHARPPQIGSIKGGGNTYRANEENPPRVIQSDAGLRSQPLCGLV